MTTQAKPSSKNWYEVVLNGPHDLIHGLLTGLEIGSGSDGTAVFAHEEAVAEDNLAEKIKEFIHVHPHECHVLMDSALRGVLKRNARKVFIETGVEIVSDRRIRRAAFSFRYQAYARRYADEIRGALENLPAGAKLVNHRSRERIDPAARGPEGYAPEHDYEIEGSGQVRGRFDVVAEARRALDAHPLIDADLIELERA